MAIDITLGTPLQQLRLRQSRIGLGPRGTQGVAFDQGLKSFASHFNLSEKSTATRASFKSFLKEAETITGTKLLTGAGKATDFAGTLQSGFFKAIEESGASATVEKFRVQAAQAAQGGAIQAVRASLLNLGPEARAASKSLTDPQISSLLGGVSVRRLQKDKAFRTAIAKRISNQVNGLPQPIKKAVESFTPAQPTALKSSVNDEVKRLVGINNQISKFAIRPTPTVGASLIKPTLKGE